jgi:hypothetical protein
VSFWANVVWAKVLLGKRCMGKCLWANVSGQMLYGQTSLNQLDCTGQFKPVML